MLREVGIELRRQAFYCLFLCLVPSIIHSQIIPECSSAVELTPVLMDETVWSIHSGDAVESVEACTGEADDDRWFKFDAASENDVIEAWDQSTGTDLVIEWASSCDDSALSTCFDNYPSGEIERALPGNLQIGQTYFFRVHSKEAGVQPDFSVRVRTFMDGGLNPNYCDVIDYQLSNSIYALRDDLGQLYTGASVGVNGYRFRFTHVASGAQFEYAHPSLLPYIQLVNVGGLQHGEEYMVAVQHRVQLQANATLMNVWSPFGSECPIGLDSVLPTTQLIPSLCPSMQDLDFESWIGASSIIGADQYRFRFEREGEVLYRTTPSYGFSLSDLGTGASGLKYGSAVYDVTVEMKFDNEWSASGEVCQIAMVSQPHATRVLPTHCGSSYDFPAPNFLLSEYVYGATAYEFRFKRTDGPSGYIYELTAGPALPFHLASNFFSSGDYIVDVRAFAGGVWGDFGSACSIYIDAGPIIDAHDGADDLKISGPSADILWKRMDRTEVQFTSLEETHQYTHFQLWSANGLLIEEGALREQDQCYIASFETIPTSGPFILILWGNTFTSQVIYLR
ncbi:MAG: hypothetical protein HKN79_11615 [Flavobacteriales bacterium]|nr:hypothetical protein [Flavobacteriales bacterium]